MPEAVAFARTIKAKMLEQFPDIEIRLVGMAVMNNAFPEASQQDVMTLYPLALAFCSVGGALQYPYIKRSYQLPE